MQSRKYVETKPLKNSKSHEQFHTLQINDLVYQFPDNKCTYCYPQYSTC